MRPFLIALQFLTRIPVRLREAPKPRELGLSLLCYPLVGLLFGTLLAGLAMLFARQSPTLAAALLLALWVGLSGALHLDGLADMADAWIGGRGDRERMLAIMKDPHSGPIAVAAIVVVLLLKFAALQMLLTTGAFAALLLPPVLARTSILALLATTPYVRPLGLGTSLSAALSKAGAACAVIGVAAIAIALFRLQGVLAVASAAAGFTTLRAALMQSLDGTTGDGCGAMIELVETIVLIVIAMSQA